MTGLKTGDPALAKRKPMCLRPEKLAFRSEYAALRYLRRRELIDEQEPYRCSCGAWHTTTKIEAQP